MNICPHSACVTTSPSHLHAKPQFRNWGLSGDAFGAFGALLVRRLWRGEKAWDSQYVTQKRAVILKPDREVNPIYVPYETKRPWYLELVEILQKMVLDSQFSFYVCCKVAGIILYSKITVSKCISKKLVLHMMTQRFSLICKNDSLLSLKLTLQVLSLLKSLSVARDNLMLLLSCFDISLTFPFKRNKAGHFQCLSPACQAGRESLGSV